MNLLDRIAASLGNWAIPSKSCVPIVDWIWFTFRPSSVVDVGCGDGAFLRRFRTHGCRTIGLDQRAHVSGVDDFRSVDLRSLDICAIPSAAIALCAEVAEHIPRKHSETLVRRLCEAAPLVIFGAGIPKQGGWGHVNEQWPSWWARLFERHGYYPFDNLRRAIWRSDVAPWYAQDLLIYCDMPTAEAHHLRWADPLDVVHPGSWDRIGPMGILQRIRG